jgi:hypothetical protein
VAGVDPRYLLQVVFALRPVVSIIGHIRGIYRAIHVSVKVVGVVLNDERIRMLLGWLAGGARAKSA